MVRRPDSRIGGPFVLLEEEAELPRDDPAPSEPNREAFAAAVDEYWSTVYRFLYCSTGHAHRRQRMWLTTPGSPCASPRR